MRVAARAQSSAVLPAAAEFSAVFDAHAGFVWRVLRYVGVREADLPDVTQEVFVVVHRRLSSFDAERGALRTWLFGIAQNVARNHQRLARHRHEVGVDELPEEADSAADPEAQLSGARARQLLARALEALGPEQRTVLVLHDLEEVPMQQIADEEGIPVATAYSRLRLARAKLNGLLAEAGGGSDR